MLLGLVAGLAASLAPIADVRVGDDGMLARVEIVCSQPCFAEPLDDQSFLIRGAKGDFSADVTSHSNLVNKIAVKSSHSGAAITISTIRTPRSVSASLCGHMKLCFDFDMSRAKKPSPPRVTLAMLKQDLDGLYHRAGLTERIPGDIAQASKDKNACRDSEIELAKDAWNLFAYRAVAVCRAREGNPAEAARYLARLETFMGGETRPEPKVMRASLAALR